MYKLSRDGEINHILLDMDKFHYFILSQVFLPFIHETCWPIARNSEFAGHKTFQGEGGERGWEAKNLKMGTILVSCRLKYSICSQFMFSGILPGWGKFKVLSRPLYSDQQLTLQTNLLLSEMKLAQPYTHCLNHTAD